MDFLYHFQKLCHGETRRSILAVGIVLAIVLVYQSSTLPDGNALFSLFSFGKNSLSLGRNSTLVENSTMVGNNLNSMNYSIVLEGLNNTEVSVLGNNDHLINGTKGKDEFEQPIRGNSSVNDSSSEHVVAVDNNSTSLGNTRTQDSGYSRDKARGLEAALAPMQVNGLDGNSSTGSGQRSDSGFTLGNVGAPEVSVLSIQPAVSPTLSLNSMTLPKDSERNSSTSEEKQATQMPSANENLLQSSTSSVTSDINIKKIHEANIKKGWAPRTSSSKMYSLLLQSRISSHSVKPQWPSKCDGLLYAKTQIENSPIIKEDKDLYPYIYQNVSRFKRSYEMMEHTLKVSIYKEGEKPIFHEQTEPILKGIYASEGWFMKMMEDSKQFVVSDPTKAHLFYMPFSSRMLQLKLYVPDSHKRNNLSDYLKNYVDMLATKYPFWNRTGGRDHFLVACHDWAPFETRHHMDNCIKVLCNANAARDFKLGKI
ncbi:hypothetical protein MKX01_001082 [Papaver californicum]|nr:hypothetical protein MKX01_001082 [Papaver californicum]